MKTESVEFNTMLNTLKTKATLFVKKGREEIGYVDVNLVDFANPDTKGEAFEMLIIRISVGMLRTSMTKHQENMLRLTINQLLQ